MMPLFFFLFFLFMVIYALLINYYHSAWNQLPEFVLPEKQASVFISVIIAARNEEQNIPTLLQSLQDQQYPKHLYNQSSLLSVFQTLNFLTLQGITAASVYKRFHSMCNGANLAYEKSAFYEVGGFNNIDNIASGDDMLLMHKIFKQYPDKVFYLK